VQRTALIPFWARAQDFGAARPLLADTAAHALAERVAAEFGVTDLSTSQRVGCCLRGRVIDDWIRRLSSALGRVTIIELGVGLNTRASRLTGVDAEYVEVDHASIMELRATLIPDGGGLRIGADLADLPHLSSRLPRTPGERTIFVLEGVLTYLQPADVALLFDFIGREFPGATLLFDSMAPWIRALQRGLTFHDGVARYAWSVARTRRLRAGDHDLHVVEELGFMDLPGSLVRDFGPVERAIYSLPLLRRAYRLTLARVRSHEPGRGGPSSPT
jgi:O-methyltransferase involved in polyketide biosynthesis